MDGNIIRGLPTLSQAGDEATSKDYVLTLIKSVFRCFSRPRGVVTNDWKFTYGK